MQSLCFRPRYGLHRFGNLDFACPWTDQDDTTDWSADTPIAVVAWRVVCRRLEEGVFILDLIREAEASMSGATSLPWLFYRAIWYQLMLFLGGMHIYNQNYHA